MPASDTTAVTISRVTMSFARAGTLTTGGSTECTRSLTYGVPPRAAGTSARPPRHAGRAATHSARLRVPPGGHGVFRGAELAIVGVAGATRGIQSTLLALQLAGQFGHTAVGQI